MKVNMKHICNVDDIINSLNYDNITITNINIVKHIVTKVDDKFYKIKFNKLDGTFIYLKRTNKKQTWTTKSGAKNAFNLLIIDLIGYNNPLNVAKNIAHELLHTGVVVIEEFELDATGKVF